MRAVSDIFYNFHWVVPGRCARSAQAYAGFLGPFLKRHGIRVVVNLRGPNPNWRWWHYEKRVCDKHMVEHYDVMLSSRRLPTRQMLVNLIAAFDRAAEPVLLKCSGGQDRTSFAAALYLLHKTGWDAAADAHGQFARWPYLHLPKLHQRWLKAFVDYARESAGGRPLADWIAHDYTPEGFKTWLQAHGLGEGFRGLYDKPGTAPGI